MKGTLNRYLIDMWPAARLIRSLGTKSGETFFGPFFAGQDYGPRRGGWRLTPSANARDVL